MAHPRDDSSGRRNWITEALTIVWVGAFFRGLLEGWLGLIPSLVAGLMALIYPDGALAAVAGGVVGVGFGGWMGSQSIHAFSAGRRLWAV
jgi:hypothetical protein